MSVLKSSTIERIQRVEREAFSFDEFGDCLGVSAWTVRRLVDAKQIAAIYVGARRVIPKSELARVLSTGAVIPKRK